MDVVLLYHTPEPARCIAAAARLCYSKFSAKQIAENIDDCHIRKLLSTIIESGHHSALEHASYTFSIEGISRSCSHQLVRHRLASYNQQSQRYVKAQQCLPVVEPSSVQDSNESHMAFKHAIDACQDAYKTMIECGVPAEDARFVLPNAVETKIVVTMNVRELLHFFSIRCCNRAQWEIRQLAWKMLDLAKETSPILFADAGPSCVRGQCGEIKMSCKKPYDKVSRKELQLEL